jgi:hypothetical protein
MRAALIHANGTLWLAGDPAATVREFPPADDFRIAGDKQLQTDLRVRAAEANHTDRGNLATTVSFGTSRLFATPAAAQVWAGLYDGTQPNTGTLVVCAADAGALPLLNFPGAVVRPPRREVIGCTVLLGYEVECGLPVAVTAATGTVAVSGALAGDTLNLFGYVFTATDAANPAPPLWNKTAAGLAAAITAQRGWLVTAAVAGNEITLTSVILGADGNDITLATNAAERVILSGATLTGGTGISTQTPLW